MVTITPELKPQWEKLLEKGHKEIAPWDIERTGPNEFVVLGSDFYQVRFGKVNGQLAASCSCQARGLCKHIPLAWERKCEGAGAGKIIQFSRGA